jgi:hypothetical protein
MPYPPHVPLYPSSSSGLGGGPFLGLHGLADGLVSQELPPLISITETKIKTVTHTVPPMTQIEILTQTETVTLPPAAHTRGAAHPVPAEHVRTGPPAYVGRPTTAVEIVQESISLPPSEVISEEVDEIVEEDFDDSRAGEDRTVTVVQRPRQTRRPTRWFGGRW